MYVKVLPRLQQPWRQIAAPTDFVPRLIVAAMPPHMPMQCAEPRTPLIKINANSVRLENMVLSTLKMSLFAERTTTMGQVLYMSLP
jgi:hypothetical protein